MASGPRRDDTQDPVCGKGLDVGQAAAFEEHGGMTYRFCSAACRERFVADPTAYAYVRP